MPRLKQSLAARRALAQAGRAGEEFRVARSRLALSRAAVANRAGLARSTVERVEGGAADVSIRTLTAAMAAVGLDLVLHSYPGGTPRLRDGRHARLVEQLRLMSATHWHARVEVLAGDHGPSADLVLYGKSEVIHIVVERRVVDLQAQLRTALRKRDALSQANADRPVRLVLAVEYTRHNRDALAEHSALLTSQLSRTPRQVLKSLRLGPVLGGDGFLWLRADPR
jgi:transcriptional regulator with XRE-family HTH domain